MTGTGFHPYRVVLHGLLAALACPWLFATATLVLQDRWAFPAQIDVLTLGVRELQQYLSNGTITSVQLVQKYLDNIAANNHAGLELRAVIETAPYENIMALAQEADDMRANGTILSELHGIPMLFKDNIGTDPLLGMNTTAGNYGFLTSIPPGDCPVSARLRAKGVLIIGKANLSELAHYKGNMTNGWSARGGQTQSAYVVGGFPAGGDPCGSSSGSAVGVSAGFAAASLGSETDGSLVCPASRAALYTIRMSVGLSSRTGVIPISNTQDTVGPMAKSTYDAALVLENMVGLDPNDTATAAAAGHIESNYTQYTYPEFGATFKEKKLVVPPFFLNTTISGNSPTVNTALHAALKQMASLGATITYDVDIPSQDDLLSSNAETVVLGTDIKVDLAKYFAQCSSTELRSLEDLINFNDANADIEFAPGECCQQRLIGAVQTTGTNTTVYSDARAAEIDIGRTRGIDWVLDHYGADAMVLSTEGEGSRLAGYAQYPIVSVPLGYLSNGQPFGMAFIGRRWSEPLLINLMAAWEANSPPRQVPSQLR